METNAIEATDTERDIGPSTPVEIIPGFVDILQPMGLHNSYSVALGDIDGDGDLDVVSANSDQGNRIYLNDGQGNFTDSNQALGDRDCRSVVLADVDNDGDLDIAVANFDQANRVYFGSL